jgi:hypothetical protein
MFMPQSKSHQNTDDEIDNSQVITDEFFRQWTNLVCKTWITNYIHMMAEHDICGVSLQSVATYIATRIKVGRHKVNR